MPFLEANAATPSAASPLSVEIPHNAFLVCHFPSFAFASLKLSWISFTLAGFFNIS